MSGMSVKAEKEDLEGKVSRKYRMYSNGKERGNGAGKGIGRLLTRSLGNG